MSGEHISLIKKNDIVDINQLDDLNVLDTYYGNFTSDTSGNFYAVEFNKVPLDLTEASDLLFKIRGLISCKMTKNKSKNLHLVAPSTHGDINHAMLTWCRIDEVDWNKCSSSKRLIQEIKQSKIRPVSLQITPP